MLPNVLSVLGISTREDVITNLLRYCIEVSPNFRDIFLRSICGIDPAGVISVRVHTRVPTDSSGLPDLVLAVECSDRQFLAVIENKLGAEAKTRLGAMPRQSVSQA